MDSENRLTKEQAVALNALREKFLNIIYLVVNDEIVVCERGAELMRFNVSKLVKIT